MNANQNRLTILTQSEIQDYFGIPRLTQEDREYYFGHTDIELSFIEDSWQLDTKLYIILQLGYFKAKQMLFNFNVDEVTDDITYILETYFPYKNNHVFKVPSNPIRVNLHKIICNHFNFQR